MNGHRHCWKAAPNFAFKVSGIGVLPLLQTCKAIHSEAIGLLYNTLAFTVHDLATFIALARAIRPEQFSSIQSLRLDARYPDAAFDHPVDCVSINDLRLLARNYALQDVVTRLDFKVPTTWVVSCSLIRRMKGLRKLKVQLSRRYFIKTIISNATTNGNSTYDELILGPLTELSREELDFSVDVDWPAANGNEMKNLPFKLKRGRRRMKAFMMEGDTMDTEDWLN
ncbi:hypothetical protein K469DRAFT_756672 [Zopfia rhizophila CBS 207.26]|uniref:DUF7730 domain-containing protein n=1 Tax=Zopfia rhizophila CBS 207.26 TaxID=1314779 RepID=A0A6A6D9H5_9PEZI|nr:hypothetical protein K469DRAFT_756672 [Zopfia rhizophila CBS 207.26]